MISKEVVKEVEKNKRKNTLKQSRNQNQPHNLRENFVFHCHHPTVVLFLVQTLLELSGFELSKTKSKARPSQWAASSPGSDKHFQSPKAWAFCHIFMTLSRFLAKPLRIINVTAFFFFFFFKSTANNRGQCEDLWSIKEYLSF